MIDGNVGLVLEGGGMRGAYTSGVLDALMDEKIKFPYVIGVSAGANNGANFVAEQRERNKKVFVDHVGDKEYSGFRHFIREKSYFNMEFLFEKLPDELVPFDYETFSKSPVVFKVCVTDCETGKPVYLCKSEYECKFFGQKILRASSSLPIISTPVEIDGKKYFDGGISDSIPIQKSIDDGNQYNVIVLTRNKGYRKEPARIGRLGRKLLSKYPRIIEILKTRYKRYNTCLDKIDKLEKEGKVFVFRPIKQIEVDRLERDIEKLNNLYQQGYSEAREQMNDFKKWLNNVEKMAEQY